MNNFPIIYGFPLDEQDHDFIPAQASAEYVLPSASVSYPIQSQVAICENADAVIPYIDQNNDFFDIIEILAQEECYQSAIGLPVDESPVAMPVAAVQHTDYYQGYNGYSGYTFAFPEDHVYASYTYSIEEEKKGIEFLPDECVKVFGPTFTNEQTLEAYGSSEMSQTVDEVISPMLSNLQFEDNKSKDSTSIQCQTSNEDENSKEATSKRRAEALERSRLKKLNRKLMQNKIAVPTSSDSRPNARQQAAAKRVRENGKFKRNQIKWVTASDIFK